MGFVSQPFGLGDHSTSTAAADVPARPSGRTGNVVSSDGGTALSSNVNPDILACQPRRVQKLSLHC